MTYQVLIQPPAFEEIETAYRWMCDYLSANAANQWYYDLQDAIAFLKKERSPFIPDHYKQSDRIHK